MKTSIYKISKMLFSNTDFHFFHLASFNFAHLESCGLIWVKLQNGRIHLQNFISSIYKLPVSGMGFIFAHFVYKRSFGQIWVKTTEWSIRFENFHFGPLLQIMVFYFAHFEYEKDSPLKSQWHSDLPS